jgi:DNA topoisomerase-6 subunit B
LRLDASALARKQREISIAEFFTKNRHLLGFDNPRKALLTAIKEGVDNSLDACEEAGVLPEVRVEVHPLEQEDRFRVVVEDNGPGIVKAQIPRIFGKLLYGSKFHRLKMSRGQQGIGISAAGMYGQLTTGKPVKIVSRPSPKQPAHYYEILIDTQKNEPRVVAEQDTEWDGRPHGTRVEIELEARYQKGRQSVDDYLEQTAVANPHVRLTYLTPEGQQVVFDRASDELPPEPREIKPHPHGIEVGMLIQMLENTKSRTLKSFLMSDFSRVSSRVADEILTEAKLEHNARPSRIAHQEADKLLAAIKKTKIMNPPSDCVAPIGEEMILKALKERFKADFYTATSRSPVVYRGNPFIVEAGLAYGGDQPTDATVRLVRLANRVPLLYQQSSCAITRSVTSIGWKSYGLSQSNGSLPAGPMTVLVHVASVWVPFTSESKEGIAHYPEIIKEIKLALQECGRKLSQFVRKRRREAEEHRKQSYIEKYIPHIGIALREILNLSQREETQVVELLTDVLERSRKA